MRQCSLNEYVRIIHRIACNCEADALDICALIPIQLSKPQMCHASVLSTCPCWSNVQIVDTYAVPCCFGCQKHYLIDKNKCCPLFWFNKKEFLAMFSKKQKKRDQVFQQQQQQKNHKRTVKELQVSQLN